MENRITFCGVISYAVKLLVKSSSRYAPSRRRKFAFLTSFYYFSHNFQAINFILMKQGECLRCCMVVKVQTESDERVDGIDN